MYTDFGVSIPAVRVRYIEEGRCCGRNPQCFNSRSAGKIHYEEYEKEMKDIEFQFPQCG